MKLCLSFLVLFLSSLLHVQAQDFNYQDPTLVWQARTTDDTSAGVVDGNGIYLAPDSSMIVSTSSDGTLRAFQPQTGEVLWTFVPENLGFAVRCWSGVTFSFRGNRRYMVYAIADGAVDRNNSPLAETRVIAVDTMGNLVFQSTPLPGIAAGTPVTDGSGEHILVTHNVDRLEGYLSVFLVSNLQAGTPLAPVFSEGYSSQESSVNGTMSISRPFSPIGFYHSPLAGWYDGGVNNTNDVFLFAWDTARTASSIGNADGQVFVFQFPVGYANDGQGLSFAPMGSRTDFHAITPPVLTNQGLSMYWTITRATTDCYIGELGFDRTFFSRGRTGRATFDRAERPAPAFQAPRAPVTLSSDPVQPMVYGVGANAQIWSATFNYGSTTVASTPDLISSRLMITQDDQFLIYGTRASLSPEGGALYMVPVNNLGQARWSVEVSGGVLGDIALNGRGTIVYVGDVLGQISAYQFGENLAATEAPTFAPTPDNATPAPTTAEPTISMAPTGESDYPSMVPNASPVMGPPNTDGSTSAPVSDPDTPPVDEPTSSASSKIVTLIFGLTSTLLAFLL